MSQDNPFRLTPDQHRAVAKRLRKVKTLEPERYERMAQMHELIAAMQEGRQASKAP